MKVSFDIMCVDERDSPNLTELSRKSREEIKNISNRRHFGLCGVIIPGAEYPEVNINGRKIQEHLFGTGIYHPFHYVDMLNRRSEYSFLGTDISKLAGLKARINNYLDDIRFKIIGSFVDKQMLALNYGVFSERDIIIAEARGSVEDKSLLDSFYHYQRVGTGSLSGKELRSHIVDLLIIHKKQNHLGTQIADLVAYPMYDYFVPNHSSRNDHLI